MHAAPILVWIILAPRNVQHILLLIKTKKWAMSNYLYTNYITPHAALIENWTIYGVDALIYFIQWIELSTIRRRQRARMQKSSH